MPDAARYERDGQAVTIAYNRPEALNAAWTEFREDEEAKEGRAAWAERRQSKRRTT